MIYSHFVVVVTWYLKFHYKQEGTYSIGTVGVEDVDCDFVDFTYVSQFIYTTSIISMINKVIYSVSNQKIIIMIKAHNIP